MPGTEIFEDIDAINNGADKIAEINEGFEARGDLHVGLFAVEESGSGYNGMIDAFYAIRDAATVLKYTMEVTSKAIHAVADRLNNDQELISESFQGDNI